jgi:hypothetical protein
MVTLSCMGVYKKPLAPISNPFINGLEGFLFSKVLLMMNLKKFFFCTKMGTKLKIHPGFERWAGIETDTTVESSCC